MTQAAIEPICIAAFHRIASRPQDELSYTPARFRRLCAYWRDTCDVVALERCFTSLPATARPRLVITFDDGYADNAEVAADILAVVGLPATFFLPSAWIGAARSFPWDAAYSPPPAIMSWHQARRLVEAGFAIGSHTRTHTRLAACDARRREAELRDSRRELEDRLGRAILDFAYPFGGRDDCREDDRRAVAAAGYRCCLSCHGGLANPADPLRWRRVAVSPRWHASPRAWQRQWRRACQEWEAERLWARLANGHLAQFRADGSEA